MKPTTDDVLKWAKEAGLYIATDVHWMPIIGLNYLEKATALAYAAGAADMKERAAKVCLKEAPTLDGQLCAEAIRALGDDE